MPKYNWHKSDDVTAVEVRENLQYRYALLHMREGMSADELSQLQQKLQRRGFTAIPDAGGNEALLRVRGFDKASALFDALRQEGFVKGNFACKEALDIEKDQKARDIRKFIKDHSIQLAGATYLFADAMPILSGVVRKTPSEVIQGAMWGSTSLGLLLFGRKNPNIQMANMYGQMKDYLQNEGVSIADDNALSLKQLKSDSSTFNSLVNFFYEHPILFNNGVQGLGGVMQLNAGRAQDNLFKTWAGASVAAGMWSGLLTPEDKYAGLSPEKRTEYLMKEARGEQDEGAGFSTRLFDDPINWVREKPLRLSGYSAIIGNFLTGASAVFHDRHLANEFFGVKSKELEWNPLNWGRDYKRSKHELLDESKAGGEYKRLLDQQKEREVLYTKSGALSGREMKRLHDLNDSIHTLEERKQKEINRHIGWKFTILTPVANLIANTLYGMSSKDERSVNLTKEGYLDELITLAANIYMEVPKEVREEKIEGFAGFISTQPDMTTPQKEIAARLREKIDALKQSPWANKIKQEKQKQPEQETAPAIG